MTQPKSKTLTPTWTYLSLRPTPAPSTPSMPSTPSPTEIRHILLALLTQHLGDHGAAIPIDVLAPSSQDQSAAEHEANQPATTQTQKQKQKQAQIIIRVPHEDGKAVMAALASASVQTGGGQVQGFSVRASAGWLAALVAEEGMEGLFDFGAGEAITLDA